VPTATALVRLRVVAAALTAVLALNACSTWHVEQATPAQFFAARRPSQVQLRRQDGHRVVMRHPFVRNDSVIGLVRSDTTAVPLDSIGAIAVRRVNAFKTVGITVLGTTAALFGLACVAACGWGSSGFSFGP